MKVDKNIKKLAKEIKKTGHTLYIVGGYVRDFLLDLDSTDIDICSSLDIDTLCKICESLQFKYSTINKKLGTIQISCNNIKYEYTQFRSESYSQGNHSPNSVEFVADINIDAVRRDLTINSIYYDILNEQLVDPVNGIKDLHRKILRTPKNPEITLNDDGLRILRLIRFASTYDFKFDKKTLKQLILNTAKLKYISAERILKEIKQLQF